MNKIALGASPCMYPLPTVIVGTQVDGKPNYMTLAFCGMVQLSPPMLAIGVNKKGFSNKGIQGTETFSVNIPSVRDIKYVDYCGLVSGSQTDKAAVFNSFYGKLETAPMIEECPVNLECKLVRKLDFNGSNYIYVGEIVQVYSNEDCITGKKPDLDKIKPVLFTLGDIKYWSVGECLGPAGEEGKKYIAQLSAGEEGSRRYDDMG